MLNVLIRHNVTIVEIMALGKEGECLAKCIGNGFSLWYKLGGMLSCDLNH